MCEPPIFCLYIRSVSLLELFVDDILGLGRNSIMNEALHICPPGLNRHPPAVYTDFLCALDKKMVMSTQKGRCQLKKLKICHV